MIKQPIKLHQLLSLGEDHHLEYKLNVNAKVCGAQVCAFLNSEGGYLLCGVADNGILVGINDAAAQAMQLELTLRSQIQPPVLFSVEVQRVENKDLLVIEVPAGKDIPYAYNNDIYIRQQQRTCKADVASIREMVLRKQVAPERWERLFSPELDESQLSVLACQKLFGAPRLPATVKQSTQGLLHQLQQLSLAKYGRLTNAADVLLAQDASRRYPQTRVRAVAYQNKADDSYLDLQHFSGPIVEVIEQLYAFIVRNTPSRARFSSQRNQRQDLPLYPEQAIREGIINAFAHRDYSHFAGGIKVEVSQNQLQIWNSGSFPAGINEQSLLQGHLSILRNPDIAHALYLQGYMEKLGRGSVVIRQACQQAELPAPQWHSDSSGVTLTLSAPQATTEVARLVSVMNGVMTRAEIQQKMGLSNAEHFRKNYLVPALTQGVIEMTLPDKPNSPKQQYRLTALGKKWLSNK